MTRTLCDTKRFTVDVFLGTGHEVADRTAVAAVAMPTMPATTDALTDLPLLLGRWDRRDIANDFMARNKGVLRLREDAVLGGLVAVRDPSVSSIRSVDTQYQ